MKQGAKLAIFLVFCITFVSLSLYAGQHSYRNCNRCHLIFEDHPHSPDILTGLGEAFPSGIKL